MVLNKETQPTVLVDPRKAAYVFHSDGCATAYLNFAVGDNRQTIQGDYLGLQVGLRSPLNGPFKMLQDDQRIASFWALGSRYSRVRDWAFVGAMVETSGPVLVTPRRREMRLPLSFSFTPYAM